MSPTAEQRSDVTVECCLRNVPAEFRALVRDDLGLREAPCKEHCGICRDRAFLIVDGEVRTGESHRAILESAGITPSSGRTPRGDPDGRDSP